LTQDFDILLIDTPALLAVSDPLVLVPHVHAVLLVVSYGRARREDVRAAAEQLMRMNPRSVSIVVNRSRDETRYGYGYAYGPKDRSVSESKNPKRGTET
jgi:Mrp family chromosome partitioning ATPase